MERAIEKKHLFSPDFHYVIKHVLPWDNKKIVMSPPLAWLGHGILTGNYGNEETRH